jgi:universal stress protein A
MDFRPTKILWPVDFSELSLRAEPYVRSLRNQFGGELHVIHVCPILSAPELTAWGAGIRPVAAYDARCAIQETEFKEIQDAARQLRGLVKDLFEDDKTIVCRILKGLPAEGICNYARDAGIELIVLATHGLTGLKHMFLGSTAEKVVRHAPCPVFTAKTMESACPTKSYPDELEALASESQGLAGTAR